MNTWLALGFQDSSSPSIGELSCLHDHIITIIFIIIFFISYIIIFIIINLKSYKFLSEGTIIETIWSIIPALLLIILVLPSIKVLYIIEDVKSPSLTFKIIAHQWYWSYVSPFFKNLRFISSENKILSYFEYDSIMEEFSILIDRPRLLNCSSSLFLPINTTSRLLITSTDVIHSFALPSLGLKVDALPGRINQLFSNPSRVGVFFGQCSEICGSNHSFMPIILKVCDLKNFDLVRKLFLLEEINNLRV